MHVWLELGRDRRSDAEIAPVREVPAFSSEALRGLFEADQAERRLDPTGATLDWERLRVDDARRRQIVRAWLQAERIQTAPDLFRAAMVFQHGRTTDDFALAQRLAERSAALGHDDARWLKAAAEDRRLLVSGLPQKYGTQFEQVDGVWRLSPVDSTVSDAERARWGVPPLAEAEAQVARLNAGAE